MDIESDDSERWEDFFGSSTDLAPSLLGIYDSLTSQLDVGRDRSDDLNLASGDIDEDAEGSQSSSDQSSCDHSSLDSEKSSRGCAGVYTLHHSAEVEEFEPEERVLELDAHHLLPFEPRPPSALSSSRSRSSSLTLANSSTGSANSNTSGNGSSCSSPGPGSNRSRSNIRVLSPNVQRIISHSDAEPVEAVDIDALQQQQQQSQSQNSLLLSPVAPHRFTKKPPPSCSTPLNGHKLKLSHIPLSKVTGKLTQSGSELVETFDSSSEYLDALGFAQADKQQQLQRGPVRKPPTPAIVPIPGAGAGADDDKTPTNATPFNFDVALTAKPRKLALTLPQQDSLQLIETEQRDALLPSARVAANAKEFVATEPLDATEVAEAVNFALVSRGLAQLSLDEELPAEEEAEVTTTGSPELVEAVNRPLVAKPLGRSVSAACASTIAGSPLLTYARAKSLAVKANTLGGPVPVKLPTAQQLAELEEASKISAESLDRLTDIKSRFSPKESRKISGLMLPEIAKLKHRPLSSSSICSTSSSSSSSSGSGSDQLNGKLATSYLASVESLADQSENELMDPHSGMSVFERACMEIVDSERSYVEDLGQVIRGYLQDWKERACLRYDELRILFSNIEEIYEFNSTLLKQLINSGMDPAKIAKCFIDLRDRFDVYTTYCTSYPEAISLLTRLLQATHTNALLTSTQKMLQHTLPLGSYLLKPVQRILKYHLLLDNLRKHCDVKEVFQAHELMRQVARHIDQVKRKLEQQSRVKELSGILDGWLGPELTVLGELRQEGLLMEHNKPRMVFLFGTMLIITKPKEDNRLQFKSYIHQNNLMLSEHLPGEPTSFYVIPYDEPRNQIKLTAKNRDQKRLWAQHIKGVILEKFDNIPNRAKELVYKLGDEEDRTPDKNTWKWSLHSTSSTPVYLERRNQYRRSEMRNRSKMKRKTVANSSSFESFNEAAELVKDSAASAAPARGNSMDDNLLPALQKLPKKAEAVLESNGSAPTEDEQKPPAATTTTKAATSTSTSTTTTPPKLCKCEASSCACLLRDGRSAPRSPLFGGGKTLKERSKSVPRISFQAEDYAEERQALHASHTSLDQPRPKAKGGSKAVEIRQYTAKTIPKRIATLKKQRSSKKETSRFYMDLSEFEAAPQTELKITESSENLAAEQPNGVVDETPAEEAASEHPVQAAPEPLAPLSPAEKARQDAQLVLDLLKHNKELERLLKKPQKKRAPHEGPASGPTSPEPRPERDLPPRPPSRSPPPLESEGEARDDTRGESWTANGTNGTEGAAADQEEEEPIYESLLRNVHVPYKFSPVLGRAPAPGFRPRERKSPPAPRPESDYVTLVYSPEGTLQQVGGDLVNGTANPSDSRTSHEQRESSSSTASSGSSSSCATLKRDSQTTVVSVEAVAVAVSVSVGSSSGYLSQLSASTTEAIYARPMPKNLVKRLLTSASGSGSASASASAHGSKGSLEQVASSEASLLQRGRKSIDNLSLSFGRSNRPPERRVSDVSEMCRQSVIHRQGSESVGERMAHVDYADPRTLFAIAGSGVVAPAPASDASDASLEHLQRDSVFSLTSSSDSVCDARRPPAAPGLDPCAGFEYELDVEASLENDFRDSAIYSDDNDKRPDSDGAPDFVKRGRPSSPPPPPPPARNRGHPQVPPKPTAVPPPPGCHKSPVRHTKSEGVAVGVGVGVGVGGKVIVCPPHMSQSASRSWVLQQIENFNK